jgi:uncharacterized protein (DUF2225 family)
MFKSHIKQKSLSFRQKEKSKCPVCNFEWNREQLLSGGGRLIAGKLMPDLRRTYEINKKFGKVYPMAYVIYTCPQCLYSAFPNDFSMLLPAEIDALKQRAMKRKSGIARIVGPIDFNEDRNFVLGAASYVLAIDSYQLRGKQVAPTPKKGICSIRAGWLFEDMNAEFPNMNFDKLSLFFYLKAINFYQETLEIMSTGREPHDQFVNFLGPDTDNNWGFDGVIYLNGYLTKKYIGALADSTEKKIELLDRSKRHLGKLYGMGKASKSKPSVLIDLSKDLYDQISDAMEKLKGAS